MVKNFIIGAKIFFHRATLAWLDVLRDLLRFEPTLLVGSLQGGFSSTDWLILLQTNEHLNILGLGCINELSLLTTLSA